MTNATGWCHEMLSSLRWHNYIDTNYFKNVEIPNDEILGKDVDLQCMMIKCIQILQKIDHIFSTIVLFVLLYMLIQIIRISNLNWRTLIIFQLMYCDCCWSVKLVYYKIGASDIVALCCKPVNDSEKIELVELESSMFNMMTLLWQCISSMFNMMILLLYYCWYWLVD